MQEIVEDNATGVKVGERRELVGVGERGEGWAHGGGLGADEIVSGSGGVVVGGGGHGAWWRRREGRRCVGFLQRGEMTRCNIPGHARDDKMQPDNNHVESVWPDVAPFAATVAPALLIVRQPCRVAGGLL